MKTVFKIIFLISALQLVGVLIDKNIDWRIDFNNRVSSDLNLRIDTTFSDNVIEVIPAYATIEIITASNNWTEVKHGNSKGFVVNDYLINEELRPSQVFFLLWITLHLIAIFYFTIVAKAGLLKSIGLFIRNIFSPWIAFRLISTLLKRFFTKQKDLEVITFKHSAA